MSTDCRGSRDILSRREEAPEPNKETPNVEVNIKCTICAQLGHILDCCKNIQQPPCSTCTSFADLLDHKLAEQRTGHPGLEEQLKDEELRVLQEKEDHVESLKQQTQEAEQEEKRLDKILEQRKATLKTLQAEQRARAPVLEFTIKEARKSKKGKKKF